MVRGYRAPLLRWFLDTGPLGLMDSVAQRFSDSVRKMQVLRHVGMNSARAAIGEKTAFSCFDFGRSSENALFRCSGRGDCVGRCGMLLYQLVCGRECDLQLASDGGDAVALGHQ